MVTSYTREDVEKEHARFEPYIDKKVTIKTKGGTELKGKMVKASNGFPVFMEKNARSRGRHVTFGMFEGFVATITITEIREGW